MDLDTEELEYTKKLRARKVEASEVLEDEDLDKLIAETRKEIDEFTDWICRREGSIEV